MEQRKLTESQQAVAQAAMALVRPVLAGFRRRYPTMRRAANLCDLESVAHMAIVRGAFGYDPSKGAMSTYFGTVIERALIKEVARAQKHGNREEARVSGPHGMEKWIRDGRGTDGRLMAALKKMPMQQRHLIEDRFLSRFPVKTLAEAYGCNRKTMAKRIDRALDVLWELSADLP